MNCVHSNCTLLATVDLGKAGRKVGIKLACTIAKFK